MAVWQYDLVAIPRDELSEALGEMPVALTADQFRHMTFWKTRQPKPGFDSEFAKWKPEFKSWSSDLRMWGNEESNRVDVSYTNGHVCNIEFRLEMRSISVLFLETISAFARESNCVLVSAHSLSIVEPLRQNMLSHLTRSPGANRVWDWMNGSMSPSVESSRPRVFLSHSSADKAFVSRLATDLKSRNIPVWFDQWELKVGDSLNQKIEDGIDGSGWLAVILSKNSISSNWVQKELRAAEARELRDKNIFVLPIILDDCKIPLFLLDKVYADFRKSYEQGLEYLLKRVLEGDSN